METAFNLTIPLSEAKNKDLEIIGSKAFNLGRLIQNHFRVPNGFIINTNAYAEFLRFNKLNELISTNLGKVNFDNSNSVEEYTKIIQNSINNGQLPLDLTKEIKARYQELKLEKVAIRSSGIAEDLPTASFAGLYETYLNLQSIEQIQIHIKMCFASLWSSRAIIYRQTNKIPHNDVKLAIIVQNMVQATSAGVLFTANPITGKTSEMLAESNFGLGESIMSGVSNPDQFRIEKSGRPKLQTYKIIEKRIGQKKIAFFGKTDAKGEGIEEKELSESDNMLSSLTDKQIVHLAKIGNQIENAFGRPQDVEWAIDKENQLFVLQSRPITTLRGLGPSDSTIWTRGYSDDYWNDTVTPLFFELLGDQLTKVVNVELNSIMGYPEMDKTLLKLFKAHAYFNLKVLKQKVAYEIPKFMRNEDLMNYFPPGSGEYGRDAMLNLPFKIVRRIIAELRVNIYDPNGKIKNTDKEYERWTKEEFWPYCKEFDSKLKQLTGKVALLDLVKLADQLDNVMVKHYRLVRYGLAVHNLGMNLMTHYFLN